MRGSGTPGRSGGVAVIMIITFDRKGGLPLLVLGLMEPQSPRFESNRMIIYFVCFHVQVLFKSPWKTVGEEKAVLVSV